MSVETMITLDVEEQIDIPNDLGAETIEDGWDAELTNLVKANADVIVTCPWDGIEMPLGRAMLNIQVQITRENVDMVIAEVHQMLANRVQETVEEAEEQEKDEEVSKTKDESNADQLAPKKVTETKIKPEPAAKVVNLESTPEEPAVTVIDKPLRAEPKEVAAPAAAETTDTNAAEAEYIIDENETETLEVTKTIVLESEAEIVMEDEVAEVEVPAITDLDVDKPNTNVEIEDVEVEGSTIIVEDIPETERTIITAQFEETVEESTKPEQAQEIDLEVEMIEETIDLITEEIQEVDAETAEQVFAIMDQIIEMPAKLEHEENLSEAEVIEELEELFTELLTKLEIDHTPEMIKALARYRLRLYLAELERQKPEGATDEETDEAQTTHDSIKKQITVLVNLKKAMLHAYAIGQSTLQLYKLSFSN